jgi:type IV pilus assembly protein PilW
MISIAIGLLLLLGISTLIAQQSSSHGEMEKSSRQIENGRYAMQLLHDDIQLAGFYSEYSPPSVITFSSPDPCITTDNTANLATTGNLGWKNTPGAPSIPLPIVGYAGARTDPTPSGCLDNYKPDTAVLVIRRTSSSPSIPEATAVALNATAVAAGLQPTTYMQVSKCDTETTPFIMGTSGFTLREKDCTSTATPTVCDDGLGLTCLRQYIVRIYYISSCSVCGTDTIPTLKVVEFASGSQSIIPLVEGIENMQLSYGVDSVIESDGEGDGEADLYTETPTAAQMPSIMSIKVNLLSRNNDTTTNFTDTKTYNIGATTLGPFKDNYKRHAYSQLVRVINPSGRRE